MTYKNIVFDLDDTLYDHQLPFKRSIEKCFPTIDIQQIDNIYKRFRYWSDVAFPKYTKKLISIEQLRIFRCQKTMEEFGIDSISRTEPVKVTNSKWHVTDCKMYQLKKERIPLCALFLDQLLKHEEMFL